MRILLVPVIGILILQFSIARGADQPAARGLAPLVRVLVASNDVDLQLDILRGMHEALQGRRQLAMPERWPEVQRKLAASASAEVRQKALVLSVIFGDKQALASLRETAASTKAGDDVRRTALQTLVDLRPPDLLPLLRELIADPKMRSPALRGLATFNDAGIPELILTQYASFGDAEKADAINTLASRPLYAMALLDAMQQGKVPRRDLSAFTARQFMNLKDNKLAEKLAAVWGTIRPTAKDKTVLLPKYKSLIPPAALEKADRSHGRGLFVKTCANCHTLFGEGGKIGPDLTGSQRNNPDYLLTKLLDPSAVVAQDYQVTIIETTNGRIVNGIITKENDKTLTIQTQNEAIILQKNEVLDRKKSPLSMMPEGQLAMLSDIEVRDLMAYLASPTQVPLPPTKPAE